MASTKVYRQGNGIFYQVGTSTVVGPIAPNQLVPSYTLASDTNVTANRIKLTGPNGTGFGPYPFEDIKTVNNVRVGTTVDELADYFLGLGIGENVDDPDSDNFTTPRELTTDYWDLLDMPVAFMRLNKDENIRTTNDEIPGGTYKLEVYQEGNGGHSFNLNGDDIPVSASGSTYIVGTVSSITGNIEFVSGSPVATEKPIILQQPQSVTTVMGATVQFYAIVVPGTFDKSGLIFRGAEIANFKGTAYQFELTELNKGAYQFYFQRGTNPPVYSNPVFVTDADAQNAVINSQPGDATVDAGSNYVFNLDVSGVPQPKVDLQSQNGSSWVNEGQVLNGGLSKPINSTKTYRYKVTYSLPDQPDDVFYSSTFTITKQGLVQAAPTNPVNDDANNTFNWTDANGKTFEDMEYSILNSAFADIPAKPLPVGDRDLAVGDVRVRYAETDTHNASEWLSNTATFNSGIQPTHIDSPPAQLTNVVASGQDYTTTQGAVERNNFITFPSKRVNADFAGAYLETDVINDLNVQRAFLSFKKTNEAGDFPTMLAGMYIEGVSGLGYNIRVITNGSDGAATNGAQVTVPGKIRLIRPNTSTIEVHYKANTASVFSKIHEFAVDGTGILYMNIAILAGNTLKNPISYGFTNY